MTSLSDFLLTRIGEDEAVARLVLADHWRSSLNTLVPAARGDATLVATDPARVLAECEGKRRIVKLYRALERKADESMNAEYDLGAANTADDILRLLARLYADHPDYRDEWRP